MSHRRRVLILGLMIGSAVLAIALSGCTWWADPPVVELRACLAGEMGPLTVRFFADVAPSPACGGCVAEIVSYEWEFGDGTTEVTPFGWDVVHEYEMPGPVEVRVTATDSRGHRGATTLAFDVYEAAFVREWSLTLGFPVRVSGVVESRHHETLDEVVVRAKFYDPDSIRVTQGETTIFGLTPGEQSYFEIRAEEYSPWIFYADVEVARFSTVCSLDPFDPETSVNAACR